MTDARKLAALKELKELVEVHESQVAKEELFRQQAAENEEAAEKQGALATFTFRSIGRLLAEVADRPGPGESSAVVIGGFVLVFHHRAEGESDSHGPFYIDFVKPAFVA